jgi:hypothetical protein
VRPQSVSPLSGTRLICGYLVACAALTHEPVAHAQEADSMTNVAKVAHKIQARMIPMVQVPLSYNYNQNREQNQSYTQHQFQFSPTIPIMTGAQTGIILNPIFTNNINVQNQQATNQATPLQLVTYLATQTGDFVYGAGPFIQMPTANQNSGSQQTGLGVSYGMLYQPKHWVIGATAYNAWGVGKNLSAGTANVYYVNPTISYTTNNAWTINLQSWINGKPSAGQSNNTNQLILSGGNTFKVAKTHVQWQIGPTYMVTNTPTSPQGWGGYFSLTAAFAE